MPAAFLMLLLWQPVPAATAEDDVATFAAGVCPVPEDGDEAARAHASTACIFSLMQRSEQRVLANGGQRPRARAWTKASAFHLRWARAQCKLMSRDAGGGLPQAVDLAQSRCLARVYAERAYFADRLLAGDLLHITRLIAAPDSDCQVKTEQVEHAGIQTTPRRERGRLARDARFVLSGADGMANLQCKALGWKGRCRAELEHYYLSLVELPAAPAPPSSAPTVQAPVPDFEPWAETPPEVPAASQLAGVAAEPTP